MTLQGRQPRAVASICLTPRSQAHQCLCVGVDMRMRGVGEQWKGREGFALLLSVGLFAWGLMAVLLFLLTCR